MYFENCSTVNEIKKVYRQLAMKNHPDRGGDTATMQMINLQYHEALAAMNGTNQPGYNGRTESWTYYYNAKKEQEIVDKIDELLQYDLSADVEVWLIGTWIWVVNTDKNHDRPFMKKSKMRWSGERNAWYWRQSKNRSTFNKDATLSGLAQNYGLEIHRKKSDEKEEAERLKKLNA